MSNHMTRLQRLEEIICPASPTKYVIGIMDFDNNGNAAELKLRG